MKVVLICTMLKNRQSVTFTEHADAALRVEARRLGISVSELVRRIVDQWFDGRIGQASLPLTALRTCRLCGCTDDDCRDCIARTGEACHWVAPDLCSACFKQP